MGCGSPSVKTGVYPGEEVYKPTGDPKKDFFYCFDDEEIKLIEEKKSDDISDESQNYIILYNKFKFDYLKEQDETIFLKQYSALNVDKNYTGEYHINSELIGFECEKIEIVSCKINNKEKVQAKYTKKKEDYQDFIEISFNVTESQKVEQFKELLIIEYIFKIKQKKVFNTKQIFFSSEYGGSNTAIFYYDPNKMKFITKNKVPMTSNSKYELKIYNEDYFGFIIKYNEKLKLTKEEQALLKNKFSSDELNQINSSLDKIAKIALELDNPLLIYEKVNHIIKNEKDFSSEGKYVILNYRDEEFAGELPLCEGNNNVNYMITDIKVNDKIIPKVEEYNENKDGFLADDTGMNSIIIFSKDRLVIIEMKTKSTFPEDLLNSPDIKIDFRKLLRLRVNNGTSFKFEIEANGINILFDKENTKYNPIKKGNKYICSGDYQYLEGEDNEIDFIKKMKEKDTNFKFSKYLTDYVKETLPKLIILNKKEHDAYIEQNGEEEENELEGSRGEEGEGECGGEGEGEAEEAY